MFDFFKKKEKVGPISYEQARLKAIKEYGDIRIKYEEEREDAYIFYPYDDNPCIDALVVYKETGKMVSFSTYMMNSFF